MTFYDILNEYWALFSALVILVISYARMEGAIRSLKAKDDDLEKEIIEVRQELKSNNIEFQKIEVSIKAIETSLQYIKERVSDLTK